MIAVVLAVMGLLLSGAPTQAAVHWTATSTTSMAITGDIAVSADGIRFANGAAIRIKPAAPDQPEVFRIDPPANPVLLNGNRLCGEQPPSFVALYRDGGSLYVFDGPDMPRSPRGLVDLQPGMCASYHYER